MVFFAVLPPLLLPPLLLLLSPCCSRCCAVSNIFRVGIHHRLQNMYKLVLCMCSSAQNIQSDRSARKRYRSLCARQSYPCHPNGLWSFEKSPSIQSWRKVSLHTYVNWIAFIFYFCGGGGKTFKIVRTAHHIIWWIILSLFEYYCKLCVCCVWLNRPDSLEAIFHYVQWNVLIDTGESENEKCNKNEICNNI